jgi:hypothetical protein
MIARLLPDGRRAYVMPLTYGRARLCVGKADDRIGYDDAY